MWDFLATKLGIRDLDERVEELTGRIDNLETIVSSTVRNFGDKQTRTNEELNLIKDQISNILQAVENILESEENQRLTRDARSLSRRLKNHRTRVDKILRKRGGEVG